MTETELMLTTIRNCRRVDLYVDPKPLDSFQEDRFEEFKKRRQNNEPLQYILGRCEFMDIPLQVDERVFIPRPETEILLEAVLEKIRSSVSLRGAFFATKQSYLKKIASSRQRASGLAMTFNILDIGTGSGNISIALAKHIKECFVVAVDFSQGCLDLAALNAKMNAVTKKIQFIQSDLFSALKTKELREPFDIIVSNPPYISRDELDSLPPEVRFEPREALDGGVDGLDFYRRIFKECHAFLKPQGWLILELGSDQLKVLERLLDAFAYLKILEVKKDLCHRNRVLVIQCNKK